MKIVWMGIKITEKEYKSLIKNKPKDKPVYIHPEVLIGADFLGRKLKFEDLVEGSITSEKFRIMSL